jgi:hypothetical protein
LYWRINSDDADDDSSNDNSTAPIKITAAAVVLIAEVTLQVDREYNSYPDSVIPCVSALKNLVLYSPKLRQELSHNVGLFSCIVRG